MSTPESVPNAELKVESAADILARKRKEKAEAARAKAEEEKLQADAESRAEKEVRDAELKSQIKKLQAEKEELVKSLDALKIQYEEGGEAVKDFAGKRKALGQIVEDNKTDLEEEGITNIEEFIASEDYSGTKEVSQYKESATKRREKVGSVVETKKGLRGKVGARIRERGESSRDSYYKKIEHRIKEIHAEIIALEDQTSERIAEKEKIEQCRSQMKGRDLPFSFNRSNLMMTSNLQSCYLMDNQNNQISFLVERFGEKVFKEALMAELGDVVSKIIEDKEKELINHGGAEYPEIVKQKTLEAMSARIDFDLTDRQIRAYEKANPEIKNIKDESENIKADVTFWSKKELEALENVRGQEEFKELDRRIVVEKKESWSNPRKPVGTMEIRYDVHYEYNPLRETPENAPIKGKLVEADRLVARLEKELDEKEKNPPLLFGKAKHEEEVKAKRYALQQARAKLDEFQRELKRIQSQEELGSQANIYKLSFFLDEKKSIRNIFTAREESMTLREFFDKIEKYWTDAKSRTLAPDKAELLAPYLDMKRKFDDLKRKFENSTRGW